MSNEIELLSTAVEFSIGLAGFSGIVAAMNRSARWTELERWKIDSKPSLAPVILTSVFGGDTGVTIKV